MDKNYKLQSNSDRPLPEDLSNSIHVSSFPISICGCCNGGKWRRGPISKYNLNVQVLQEAYCQIAYRKNMDEKTTEQTPES